LSGKINFTSFILSWLSGHKSKQRFTKQQWLSNVTAMDIPVHGWLSATDQLW
jgi:hypothetical protein